MELTLIRHAEMTGDPHEKPARPVRGCLSESGLSQARALRVELKSRRFDVALVSPLGRAMQTAEIALEGRDVPIRAMPWLIEWIPNPELDADAVRFERMQEQNRDQYAEETWKTDLGEGTFEMYARMCPPFVKELAACGIHSRMGGYVPDDDAKERSIAIFAHGGTLTVLLAFLLKIPPFPMGSFTFELTGAAKVIFLERRGIFYPRLLIPASGAA